ncbi:MAG: transketolase [Actinomycetota bacterium]|nr:MAG: transketolase [Actinomycetota bacterium]
MLSLDAVEKAKSGHEGLPLGAAPMAWTIWSRFLRFDPTDPNWPGRDRFVLSAGHGSMLLYSLLHLFGYQVSIDDLKNFRQWGSRTPGHPEYGHTPGVETTTGPLGQGISNSVGMALGEAMLGARLNRNGKEVVGHRTFVIASDGDLMEGVSNEAASLAGHLGLGKLIVLYDNNSISIDGSTGLAFTEDRLGRFKALGWSTFIVEDGNNLEEISEAVKRAIDDTDRPSIISVTNVIGYGAPHKEGTEAAHGGPYGPDEAKLTKERFGWPEEPPFLVPEDVTSHLSSIIEAKISEAALEKERVAKIAESENWEVSHWLSGTAGELPRNLRDLMPKFDLGSQMATRVASGQVLKAIASRYDAIVGGSADLVESTSVGFTENVVSRNNFAGSLIHFGVREHGMAAILNGLQLHGGFRVFGSTFLIFSDYLRPSLRLAALMGVPIIYLMTHDSVGLGEDGPTHQPVEQLESLRMVPNLAVIRPADSNEAAEAWITALERESGPTILALSRQGLPVLEPGEPGWISQSGARIVMPESGTCQVALLATGSEVSLAIQVAGVLSGEHALGVRVVSIPWREKFLAQDQGTRDALIPPSALKVSIEAGVTHGWQSIVGPDGLTIGIDRFGASAPGSTVMTELGLSSDAVVAKVLSLLGRK